MKRIIRSLFVVFALLGITSPVFAAIKFGVLANRGELEATTRWAEFGKYLSQATGTEVQIVPLAPARVTAAMSSGEVDFVLSHAGHAVWGITKAKAKPLAALDAGAGATFGGVILAKAGSGITKSVDLKGKRVMSLKFREAAGAYIFQTHHLLKKGIDPHKDFGTFMEGKKQDDLVLAVGAGLVDAAFVRTGLLEEMAKEGKIKKEDFVVVDAKKVQGFPHALTTDLYPEWCLVALPGAGPAADKVKTALFNLAPGHAAAKTAKIKGFVEMPALDEMKDALRRLKIAPFDA